MRTLVIANWGIGSVILDTLYQKPDFEIVGVVTKVPTVHDKDPWMFSVSNQAMKLNLPIIHEKTLTWEGLKHFLKENEIEWVIMHSYMKKVPKHVFETVPHGFFNVHPSWLPKYPGKDPSKAALEAGETETGITLHQIDENFDTGPIVHQVRIPIEPGDTRENLIERMKLYVDNLLENVYLKIINQEYLYASRSFL